MRILAWAALLGAVGAIGAYQPAKNPLADLKRAPTFNDALGLAAANIRTLPPLDQAFQEYLWIEEGSIERAKLMAWVVNVVGRGTVIHRPAPLGQGELLLLRMDIRLYAPRVGDLRDWIAALEDLQFEPRMNVLVTKDTLAQLRFAEGEEVPTVRRTQTRKIKRRVLGKIVKGKRQKARTVTREVTEEVDVPLTEAKDFDLVRIVGNHIDKAALAELVEATGRQAPVVTSGYFLRRALNTIQDKAVFKQLYGGLYYELAGVKENKTGKGTDEDLWFQDHVGIGNIEAGITAEKFYEKLRSDRRAAVWKSKFTGLVRRIDWGHGPSDGDGFGPWSITHDPKRGDIDITQHPFFNLLNGLKDAAREGIWGRPNGLHGFVLFNGEGKLQREVPPDVASNPEIPASEGSRILQAGIGCMACHDAKVDGWQPFGNDVRDSLGEVLGDTSNVKGAIADTRDRLVGLYGSESFHVNKWLSRGRDDYAQATLKATGSWPQQGAQGDVVKVSGKKLWDAYTAHVYGEVGAKRALLELGFDVPDAEAVKVFNLLVPPVDNLGLGVPEDVRIRALKRGQKIGRTDMDLVHGFVAQRVARTLAVMKGNR